jgi:hypothetical protein
LHKTPLSRGVRSIVLHYYALLYIKKRYAATKTPFEKPVPAFYRQYKNVRLLIRLKHWRKTKTPASLIRVHYAQIKRNPE